MGLELLWKIVGPKERSGRENETAALEGVVSTRDLQHLMNVGPHRDMNVFAALVHRLPRERHPVFPANQSADATRRRVDRRESLRVAVAPHHSFGVGRHELAVMVE